MTELHQTEPHARRLGTVALLTAFAFGCTTIRAPVAAMQSPIPIHDGSATPQLELWLESADPIPPQEAARVSAEARAAIEEALAGRVVGDGSTVLVVRAQGVTRSASHRSDQTAATVGLVLGAVVVVVGLVILIASGGKGGGKGGGGGGGRVAAAAPRGAGAVGLRPPKVSPALPVAAGARAVPPPLPRAVPVRAAGAGAGAVAVRPAPGPARPPASPRLPIEHRGSGVAWGVYVDLGPIPLQPSEAPYQVVSSREILSPMPEGTSQAEEAVAPPAPAPVAEVALPTLAPFPVEERGFFDGDALTVELTLVDRVTGEPRWTKWVEAEADPCDREAVRRVLHKALAEPAGWAPAR
jgi:hypothetical protein